MATEHNYIDKTMVGRRVLIKLIPAMAEICEVTILEVSPSGKYALVTNSISGDTHYGKPLKQEPTWIYIPHRGEVIEAVS